MLPNRNSNNEILAIQHGQRYCMCNIFDIYRMFLCWGTWGPPYGRNSFSPTHTNVSVILLRIHTFHYHQQKISSTQVLRSQRNVLKYIFNSCLKRNASESHSEVLISTRIKTIVARCRVFPQSFQTNDERGTQRGQYLYRPDMFQLSIQPHYHLTPWSPSYWQNQ